MLQTSQKGVRIKNLENGCHSDSAIVFNKDLEFAYFLGMFIVTSYGKCGLDMKWYLRGTCLGLREVRMVVFVLCYVAFVL